VVEAGGGDCNADIGVSGGGPPSVRAGGLGPDGFPPHPWSQPNAPQALAAHDTARTATRKTAWSHAARMHPPTHRCVGKLIIDLDASLVSAHSVQESLT